jgi:hypothetical protein
LAVLMWIPCVEGYGKPATAAFNLRLYPRHCNTL